MGSSIINTLEVTEPPDPSQEDIFASAIDLIFPDETCDFHGNGGSYVIYRSQQYGKLRLELAAPDSERE